MLERLLNDGESSGTYFAEAIYGANDGIVSTFAIVSGVTGAKLLPSTILIIGIASLLADGYSMAVSNYLSRRTKRRSQQSGKNGSERSAEPANKHGEQADSSSTEKRRSDGGKSETDGNRTSPKVTAFVTFLAFVVAGFAPLVPYVFDLAPSFWFAVGLTGLAFFVVGGSRTLVTDRRWYVAGGEMFLVGMSAAAVAYFVGSFMNSAG